MKLIRFMSIAEFEKFRAGELLENTTDFHAEHQQRTDAVGFCFLDYDEHDEQAALHFLSGIVNQEICAVFEVDDVVAEKGLKIGEGTFAAPMNSAIDFFASMQVTEYSTKRYSNQNMELLKYADNFEDNYDEESFDRIFEWKAPEAPVTRRIAVIDKNPVQRPKMPDSPEQRLADAIMAYMTARHNVPAEFAYGFTLRGAPTFNIERNMTGELVSTDIELVRQERFLW